MDPEPRSRVRELFEIALELKGPERDDFLRTRATDEPELSARVRDMLLADEREQTPVEEAVPAVVELLQPAMFLAEIGDVSVDPYRILRSIGRGGMGAVYLAERGDGTFERQVALKLVHRGFDSDEVMRRFQAERRILAALEHPNIARMYDAGLASDGRPFLVMEHVEGEPIDQYANRLKLDVRGRVQLFVQVCEAVAYAHQGLVIHRDLKPSNVLVGPDGNVKLLDFGIAKLADNEDTEPQTQTGLRPLTPEYASPEQLRGDALSTATDVYSLGAVLYELLTGYRPFANANAALTHAFGANGGSVIPMPSRRSELPRGVRDLRGDLDRILLKALARDPHDRYGSVTAFSEDLARYLDGRPVLARPPSLGYRTGRFIQRHRGGVAASFLAVAGLVGTTWVAVGQARRANTERDIAVGVSTFLEDLFTASDPLLGTVRDTTTMIDFLDGASTSVREGLSDQPATRAHLLYVLGSTYRNLSRSDRARPLLEEAITASRSVHGPGHRDEIQSREVLALHLAQAGEMDSALAQLDTALALQLEAEGEDSPLTWRLRERIGQTYATAQRNEEALPHLRLVVEAARSAEPVESARLASALNMYGSVLAQSSRYEDAAPVLEEAADLWAIADTSREGGPRPLDEAVTRGNLAFALLQLSRPMEAEAEMRRSVGLVESRVPELHVLRAQSNIRLAQILDAVATVSEDPATLDEADRLYQEGLDLGRQLPEMRRSIFFALSSYGRALRAWGRLEEAEVALEEAVSSGAATLGPEHPLTLTATSDLGRVIAESGRPEQGLQRTGDALATMAQLVPAEAPPRLNAATNHGRVLLLAGRPSEALELLEPTLAAALSALPPRHPMITAIEDLVRQAREP